MPADKSFSMRLKGLCVVNCHFLQTLNDTRTRAAAVGTAGVVDSALLNTRRAATCAAVRLRSASRRRAFSVLCFLARLSPRAVALAWLRCLSLVNLSGISLSGNALNETSSQWNESAASLFFPSFEPYNTLARCVHMLLAGHRMRGAELCGWTFCNRGGARQRVRCRLRVRCLPVERRGLIRMEMQFAEHAR